MRTLIETTFSVAAIISGAVSISTDDLTAALVSAGFFLALVVSILLDNFGIVPKSRDPLQGLDY